MQQKKLKLGMRFGPRLDGASSTTKSSVDAETSLHSAAATGNVPAVERLLATAIDVNARDKLGWTALHAASTKDNPHVVDTLLCHSADPEARFKDGFTALHLAAMHGQSEVVSVLLKHGAKLDSTNDNGLTPLEIAAGYDKADALRAFVDHIGDLNDHENTLGPVLHAACSRAEGSPSVRLLLTRGVSSEIKSELGQRTPLMTAASCDSHQAAAILLECGADIESQSQGITAVLIAAFKSSMGVLRLLIEHGANLDVRDDQGWTPLRAAIHNNDITVAQLLLQHRIRLNTPFDEHQTTPLHMAVSQQNPEIVKMLLQRGADVEAADTDGDTPLQWAAEKGDVELVRLLLDHSADINYRNPNTGEVVLAWAVRYGHLGLTDYLMAQNADRALVDLELLQKHPTATDEDFELCQSLVEASVSSGVHDLNVETPLSVPVSPAQNADTSQGDVLLKASRVDATREQSTSSSNREVTSQEEGTISTTATSSSENRSYLTDPKAENAEPLAKKEDTDSNHAPQIRFEVIDIEQHLGLQGLISSLPYQVAHTGVTCDGEQCKHSSSPIQGTRYKCVHCEDIDFCSTCIISFFNKHSAHHAMLRVFVPSDVYRIEEVDEQTKKSMFTKYNDPDLTIDDFSHAIYAATDHEYLQCLIADTAEQPESDQEGYQQYLHDTEPTVFAIWKDRTSSRATKQTPIFEEGIPGPNTVAYYEIDDAYNVRLRHHEKGTMPQGVGRGQQVMHHQDSELFMKLVSGQMSLYRYDEEAQFYTGLSGGRILTRVVDILPGSFDDKLDIALRVVDLLEGPVYEALSYTWKETAYDRAMASNRDRETNETFRDMIQILHGVYLKDRQGVESYLQISCGLRDALRRLRDPSKTVTFWIDQLSINQADDYERALQVSRMQLCYGRARHVILWTGDDVEHTGVVFDICRVLAHSARQGKGWPSPGTLAFESNGVLQSPRAAIWKSVFDFYERTVFSRCWCIQEIVMGLHVIVRCGEHYIQWEDLAKAAQVLSLPSWVQALDWVRRDHQSTTFAKRHSGFSNVVMINGIREEFRMTRGLPIENLLFQTGRYESSDPRDKIYSVLGLQSTSVHIRDLGDIQTDYQKSTAEVFIEGTKSCVLQSESLDICGMNSSVLSKNLTDLPSWVPDYTANSESLGMSLSRPEPANPYNACGDASLIAEWPYDHRKDLLMISSCNVDVVIAISARTLTPQDPALGGLVAEWSALADQCSSEYPNGEFSPDVFCKTLVADTSGPWRRYPAPPTYRLSLSKFLGLYFMSHMQDFEKAVGGSADWMSSNISKTISTLLKEVWETEPDWLDAEGTTDAPDQDGYTAPDAFRLACTNRKFFVTGKRYMGIGPRDMQPGDEVHVLSGTRVPFIMRKVAEDEDGDTVRLVGQDGLNLYRMIGECYVHGIMQGEATRREDVEWDGICVC